MEYQEYLPSDHLLNYIKCFWTIKIDFSTIHTNRFLFPSRCYMDLDFNISGEIIRRNNSGETVCKGGYICGVNNDYIEVEVFSDLEMFGVRFCHGGAYPFLKLPATELLSQSIDLYDVMGNDTLNNKIFEAKDTKQRVKVIESLMTKKIVSHKFDDRIYHSLQLIKKRKGNISIKELADCVNLSQRHFRRQFQIYTGTTPKSISRMTRFQHLLSAYRSNNKKEIYKSIEDCAYVDQSHVIRDFKYFTNKTPRYFVNNEDVIVKSFNKL